MIDIQEFKESHIEEIFTAFHNLNWFKPKQTFSNYFLEQRNGLRHAWVAYFNHDFAGYITLNLRSQYPDFIKNNIPEIQDLNVLPPFRNKGIGNILLEKAENKAKDYNKIVGLGVGLYIDYGAAQKIYIKRGYIPDGNGITYDYKTIKPGNNIMLDDDLCLWLTKKLG
ncbi:MAG: GNAT family N-acetyltransferase [Alphaproteobacteria bacterium]|nr:GNAT family N-acetyltransferase [Alphaproteobacteria bacterium]OJV13151.1 MAG: hypothetical protein BGO27_02760 [Alphaproteobacteria bacterium 33-17]